MASPSASPDAPQIPRVAKVLDAPALQDDTSTWWTGLAERCSLWGWAAVYLWSAMRAG
jgi:hypothetical protein